MFSSHPARLLRTTSSRRPLLSLRHWLPTLIIVGTLALAAFAGALSTMLGPVTAERPAFFLALPLVFALAFAFVMQPRLLVCAIIVARGAADPLFEGTRMAGGGLGAVLNLAVISLAAMLVVREPRRVPKAAWWAWLPFLAVQVIGVLHSPDTGSSLRLVLGQVSVFALFIAAFYLVDDLPSLQRIMRLVLLSSVPVVCITAVSIALGQSTHVTDGVDTSTNRYGAPFTHPNILAFYLVLVIGVALYLWKNDRLHNSRATRVFMPLWLLVLFAMLLATQTRSAWLAAAVLFLLYGLTMERRYLLYVLAAPALAMLVPEIRERVVDLLHGNEVATYAKLNSFAWRQQLWDSALQWMTPSHYLLGYGYNAFKMLSPTFFPQGGGLNWGAHSVLVQLFFDLGVIGLLGYLWLFKASFSMIRRAYPQHRLLGTLFIGVLFTYLVASASDNLLDYLVFNWYFWFTIGVVCAALTRQAPVPAPPARQPTRRGRGHAHLPAWPLA